MPKIDVPGHAEVHVIYKTTKPQWLPYPENKPSNLSDCLVYHRSNDELHRARFHEYEDLFISIETPNRVCLNITHFIEIPEFEEDKDEE